MLTIAKVSLSLNPICLHKGSQELTNSHKQLCHGSNVDIEALSLSVNNSLSLTYSVTLPASHQPSLRMPAARGRVTIAP